MAQILHVHPDNPQGRLLAQAAQILEQGGIAVFPTDSCYALGCLLGNKAGAERIAKLRQLDKHHDFSLMCSGLSDVASYARVDNINYRFLRRALPGPYTFILPATNDVPRRFLHKSEKTIGLRVPDCPTTMKLLEILSAPLMSVSLVMPGDEFPLTDPDDIEVYLGKNVEVIVLNGFGRMEATTVVDLSTDPPVVLRDGLGDIEKLGL